MAGTVSRLCDQMRQRGIAAFGQMDLVPHPLEVALSAIAHFWIVGRANPLSRRWHLFGSETPSVALFAAVLLGPDLGEGLDGRELLEPRQLLCLLYAIEQIIS